jgi:hypothetical protein
VVVVVVVAVVDTELEKDQGESWWLRDNDTKKYIYTLFCNSHI